jgi:hypothetical protein
MSTSPSDLFRLLLPKSVLTTHDFLKRAIQSKPTPRYRVPISYIFARVVYPHTSLRHHTRFLVRISCILPPFLGNIIASHPHLLIQMRSMWGNLRQLKHSILWLCSRKQKPTNTGEDEGENQPLYTVGGNVNCPATMEISMEVPQKAKNRAAIWSWYVCHLQENGRN